MRIRSFVAALFGVLLGALLARAYVVSRALDSTYDEAKLAFAAPAGDQQAQARAFAALEARQREVRSEVLVSGGAFLALLIGAFFVVRRTIELPLIALAEHTKRAGDVPPPPAEGIRETQDLARALETMALRLKGERAQLESILNNLAEAVAVFDRDGICVLANPASRALVGYDIVGRDAAAVGGLIAASSPDGGAAQPPPDERLDARGLLRRITTADGQTRIVSINIVSLPEPHGGMVVSARDITAEHELRERLAGANEELQAQNEELAAHDEELRSQSEELASRNSALLDASRTKSEFLATMSHELRTPLNAVIGFSEMLLDGVYGPLEGRQHGVLDDVHAAGLQLLALIDDLLDLSKIEAGRMALSVGAVEVAGVVGEAVSMVSRTAETKRIRLTVKVAPNTWATADRARFAQILLNLLSNAIKFTPEEGAVSLTATARADRVRVEVEDTGIGIHRDDASKLFQAFSQVESGHRRRFGGTGLGLSISKRLVELMRGEIGFESEPDAGSTFWFELPATAPSAHDDRATGSPSPRPPTPRPKEPPRVLVVDDVATDAAMIETSLAGAGYSVRVVKDAEAAIAAIDEVRPAMIVVDLGLPGMSGFGLIDRLRAHPRYEHLPIVVLTGRDLGPEEHRSLAARVQLVARKGQGSRTDFLARVAELVPAARLAPPRQRVLVVDDNEINRRVARAMVEALGYDAMEAGDAPTAIALARAQRPAAVLMDIQMPGMDGLAATAALRASEATAAIPVIAVTAHAMTGDAERFLRAGCVAHVPKPVGRAALARALSRALGAESDG